MSETLPVISIIGLGYIGLPLALAFGELTRTIGYDIDPNVIEKCKMKVDHAGVTEAGDFEKAKHVEFTSDTSFLKSATVHIIAVPTPIDDANIPELSALLSATEIVGANLTRGDLVIVESTVWPGLTNDLCKTLLEKRSGLSHGKDFNIGYSPERINPGDKQHTITKIKKVNVIKISLNIENLIIKKNDVNIELLVSYIEDSFYKYTYKKEKNVSKIKQFGLVSDAIIPSKILSKYVLNGKAIASGIKFAKDLGNTPPNICNPTFLSNEALKLKKFINYLKLLY